MKFWTDISLRLILLGGKGHSKENSTLKKILPFGTQYLLALPNFKNTVMENWNLIQNHLHSRVVFKSQPSMMLKRKVIKRYPG